MTFDVLLYPTPRRFRLFRWFTRAFPGVVRPPTKNSQERFKDECDNLYVDANSIVHNACHPDDRVGWLRGGPAPFCGPCARARTRSF